MRLEILIKKKLISSLFSYYKEDIIKEFDKAYAVLYESETGGMYGCPPDEYYQVIDHNEYVCDYLAIIGEDKIIGVISKGYTFYLDGKTTYSGGTYDPTSSIETHYKYSLIKK